MKLGHEYELPSDAEIDSDPVLEASALEAMDRKAPRRLAAILHADDAVLLSSSLGAASAALVVLAAWSYKYKASPHLSSCKNVAMVCGSPHVAEAVASQPPLMMNFVGRPPTPVAIVDSHKWLGLQWSSTLDLSKAMQGIVAAASSKFGELCGACINKSLPLCAVVDLFESLVEGVMRFGRWLWALSPDACSVLDDLYRSWGRALLGANMWRNWATVFGELGWELSGSGRAVIDVAMQRARLWSLAQGDLYKDVFVQAHAWPGSTWAKGSLALLSAWNIMDWPSYGTDRGLSKYKAYVHSVVKQHCLEQWRLQAANHVIPFCYVDARATPSLELRPAIISLLPWCGLLQQRSLCRLRAGLLRLGHVRLARSSARRQTCIFCGTLTASLNLHVMTRCNTWAEPRKLCWDKLGQPPPSSLASQTLALFSLRPGEAGYSEFLRWAAEIDEGAKCFWGCDMQA